MITLEKKEQKIGRNKLLNAKIGVAADKTEPIGDIESFIRKEMADACEGGSIVEKTLTMRFYPIDDASKVRLVGMAMVRPKKEA